MTTFTETVAAQRANTLVKEWLANGAGDVQVDKEGCQLRDVLDQETEARATLENRVAAAISAAGGADSAAYLDRLKHDLSWHYDEVAFLRAAMRKAMNVILRPPSLDWPGDEHPFQEASRILSEALSPARRHQ